MDRGLAPAKVNLALHVTGLRPDGFHALDSLVVFAGVGDRVAARAAGSLTLLVDGPFAAGVPLGEDNLVLRAARALAGARGVEARAALRLTKALPHAAGIGSASSDAAATLRVLAELWGVEPLAPDSPEVLALGSDVPACLHAPSPVRMRGRGEALEPVRLVAGPPPGLVLVNPGVPLPTRAVFAALAQRSSPALPPLPEAATAADLAAWVAAARNDLQAPAEALAPEVAAALVHLRRAPGVLAAVMSGSGATCVGIARDVAGAGRAARAIQVASRSWWVASGPMLS